MPGWIHAPGERWCIRYRSYPGDAPPGRRYFKQQRKLYDRLPDTCPISTILRRAPRKRNLGEAGTGCREDLQQATMLARQMVFELGMGLKTGLTVLKCVYGCVPGRENQMSEKALEAAEEEVRRILDHCYRQAQKEISESIIALYDLSAALKLKKTLYANEIAQLIEGGADC